MTSSAQAPQSTGEQLREQALLTGLYMDDAYSVLERIGHIDSWKAIHIARALAAAVTAEREKYQAVLELHTPGLHGGLDIDLKVCEECDRTWPCDTVKLIREVSR